MRPTLNIIRFSPDQIRAAFASKARPTDAQAEYIDKIRSYLEQLEGKYCELEHIRASCGGTLGECFHVVGVLTKMGEVCTGHEWVGEDSRNYYYLRKFAPDSSISETDSRNKFQETLPVEKRDFPPVFITPTGYESTIDINQYRDRIIDFLKTLDGQSAIPEAIYQACGGTRGECERALEALRKDGVTVNTGRLFRDSYCLTREFYHIRDDRGESICRRFPGVPDFSNFGITGSLDYAEYKTSVLSELEYKEGEGATVKEIAGYECASRGDFNRIIAELYEAGQVAYTVLGGLTRYYSTKFLNESGKDENGVPYITSGGDAPIW